MVNTIKSNKSINQDILEILNLLFTNKGIDLSGSNPEFLSRRINRRIQATNTNDFKTYLEYLNKTNSEFDFLADILTINYSRFFRNAFTFNYIKSIVIPKLIQQKINSNNKEIRIWSAGCATGEEAYSIAIMLDQYLLENKLDINISVFATDIDEKAIRSAKKAAYPTEAIQEIEHGVLSNYFIYEDNRYNVIPRIKKKVHFSTFDLLNTKNQVPEESIFGHFDLIFCRNVLIYFNKAYQDRILNKLHKTMHASTYLILGESEEPALEQTSMFLKTNNLFKVYKKLD